MAWASKNMLVLGFIILGGLLIHLFNFWSKMQLVEILGGHENSLGLDPADGASLIAYTFSQWYYVVIYLVWFAALWFHLTHGVWSMFQTVGWANDTWYPRLKCIANIVATIIFLGFAAVVLVYFLLPLHRRRMLIDPLCRIINTQTDMALKLDAKIPAGALAEKWSNHKTAIKVVSPANKRKLDIIIVGTGLGGASAAASLGELGYNVKVFCIQDFAPPRALASPRRAVSTPRRTTRTTTTRYTVCSTTRSRAATTAPARPTSTVWPRSSNLIIDQCVGTGRSLRPRVRRPARPTVRSAARRCRVRSTPAARRASSSCSAPTRRSTRQIAAGTREELPASRDARHRHRGRRGHAASSPATSSPARSSAYGAHAVVIATGGYGNVFFLSTNAMALERLGRIGSATARAPASPTPASRRSTPPASPYHGDQQSKLTLMSESLRNDGRIWVPKKLEDVKAIRAGS